jgi:hypothetical protein
MKISKKGMKRKFALVFFIALFCFYLSAVLPAFADSTTTYIYTSYGAGDKLAYAANTSAGNDLPPLDPWTWDYPFSAGEYTDISANDASWVTTGGGGAIIGPSHLFEIHVSESVSDITKIDIEWVGYGDKSPSDLYYWNWTGYPNMWVLLGSHSETVGDGIISLSNNTRAEAFVNSSGYINLVAVSGGNKGVYIKTNFVKVNVSYLVANLPPAWQDNYTSVQNGSEYSPTVNYGFEVTWSDPDAGDELSNVTLETNFTAGGTPINITKANASTYATTFSNTSGLWKANFTQEQIKEAGTYVFRWYANDTSNMWNKTDQWNYTIEKNTSADVNLYVNDTQANKNVDQYQKVNFTILLNSPASGYVELWTNFSDTTYKNWTAGNVPPQFENITNMTQPGNWTWVANYTNANYTTNLETWYVNVTVKPVPGENVMNITQSMLISSQVPRQTSASRIETQTITTSQLTPAVQGLLKTLSQTLDVTGVYENIKGSMRSLSQALSISNIVTRVQSLIVSISQSLNISNISSRIASLLKSVLQTMTTNDSVKGIAGRLRSLTQSLSVQNIVQTAKGAVRAVSQTLSISNVVSRLADISRVLTQSLSVTNVVSRLASIIRALTQSMSILSQVTKSTLRTYEKVVTAATTLTNSVVRSFDAVRSIVQSIVSSLNVQKMLSGFRVLTQNLQTITQAEKIAIGISERIVTLGMTIIDSVARTASAVRSLTQSIVANMSVQKILTRIRSISQVFSINNFITAVSSILRTLTQSISVTVTSIRTTLISRLASQTLNISNVVSRLGSMIRSITQSLDLSSIIVTLKGASRSVSQILSANFVTERVYTVVKTLTQNINVSNISQRLVSVWRTITQQLAISNISQKIAVGIYERAVSAYFTIYETVIRGIEITKTLTQSLTINETLIRLYSRLKTLSQSLGINSTVTTILGTIRTLTQSLTTNNLVKIISSFTRAMSETLTTNNVISRVVGIIRSVTGQFTLTNVAERLADISRVLTQSLSVTGLSDRIREILRTLTQSTGITNLAESLTSTIRILMQSLNVTNLASRVGFIFRTLTQNLSILTQVGRTALQSYDRAVSVVVSISDSIARSLDAVRSIVQSIVSSLNVQRVFDGIRTILQSLSSNSVVTRARVLSRTLSETLSINSVVTKIFGTLRSITQSLSVSNISVRVASIIRALTQNLSVTNVVSRLASIIRALTQSMSILSQVTRTALRTYDKAVSVVVSITDNVVRSFDAVRSIVQSIVSSLNVQRVLSWFRALTQSLQVITQAEKIAIGINKMVTTLAMTIIDSVARTASAVRSLTQSIVANMSVHKIFTNMINVLQSFNVNTVVYRLSSIFRSITGQITFTNIVGKFITITKSITQSLTINTAVERALIFVRTFSESLSINNVVARLGSIARLLSQSFSATGMVTRVSSISRILAQALNAVDSVVRIAAQLYSRLVSIYLSISQVIQKTLTTSRTINQAINIDTITGRIASFYRNVFDWLSFILRSIIPCGVYNAQPSCEAAGCYWYSSSCNEVPETPTTTTTAPSSPSGGGGGAYAPSIVPPPEVDVKYRVIAVLKEIAPGQTSLAGIRVKNTGASPYSDLDIEVTGVPSDWVSVNVDKLTLDTDESKGFNILVSPPDDAMPGDYRVTIKIKNAEIEAENFFILRVKSVPEGYDKPVVTRSVTIDRDAGKTDINILITNPFRKFDEIDVIENIPKEIANSSDLVDFNNPPTEIIRKDPIVLWSIPGMEVGEEQTISYSVSKILDEYTSYVYWPLRQLNLVSPSTSENFKLVSFDLPRFTAGQTSIVKFVVENPDTTSHKFTFSMDVLPGWEIEPALVEETIYAREKKEFSVKMSVPSKAWAGRYMVRTVFGWDDTYIIKEYTANVQAFGIPTIVLYSLVVLTLIAVAYGYYSKVYKKHRVATRPKLETIKRRISTRERYAEDERAVIEELREELQEELRRKLKRRV